jgi:hypothetical protein
MRPASANSLRRGRSRCAWLRIVQFNRVAAAISQRACLFVTAPSCPNLRSVMRHPVVSPLILRIEIIRLTVGSGKKESPQASARRQALRLTQAAIEEILRLPSVLPVHSIAISIASAHNRAAQRSSERRDKPPGQRLPTCGAAWRAGQVGGGSNLSDFSCLHQPSPSPPFLCVSLHTMDACRVAVNAGVHSGIEVCETDAMNELQRVRSDHQARHAFTRERVR